MKVYVLVDVSGEIYFKGYNPYTSTAEWTGIPDRACFWKDLDCAEDQAMSLSLKDPEDTWSVIQIDLCQGHY